MPLTSDSNKDQEARNTMMWNWIQTTFRDWVIAQTDYKKG